MIQDIYPHRLQNQYNPTACAALDSYIFVFQGDELLCRIEEAKEANETENAANEAEAERYFSLPRLSDFPEAMRPSAHDLTYLFSVDEKPYFLWEPSFSEAKPETAPIHAYSFCSIRALRDQHAEPKHLIFAAITAKQLADWYQNNRFCGRCGHRTVLDDRERAIRCKCCGNLVYPKIVPAVIVGVINKDQILLTKYRTGFAHYALVAGFTEIGETLEETVAREVMEETGLRVKNIRYYKSQPWGIASDILAGFYCDVDGNTEIRMDPNELKYAAWTRREDIILQPDDFSLTNEMMQHFQDGEPC